MQFGLMFFSSSEDAVSVDKYRLVIEGAKFADQYGFSSVWVPERHFTRFGWLYPNPSVLHAALARETKRIRLRAGSVVMPLHDPIRVAEEWAMVDNLSGGRVDIAFASGWHPNDFVLSPQKYADRHEETFRGLQTVQKLWQGEPILVQGGDGSQIEIRTYPTPIQRTLPVWVTAAGNPKTYARAGEIGANLLTHLFDQTIEDVEKKIALYRESRARRGHDPEAGQVTMMLHTHIGEDVEVVRERVRQPYCEYLKSIAGLSRGLAYSRGRNVDITELPEQELDEVTNFLFERFFSTRALLGTPEKCVELVDKLAAIGVGEIACLLDFGVDIDSILQSLPYLNKLKELCSETVMNRSRPREGTLPRDIQARCREEISGPEFYNILRGHGIEYGASFRGIERLWRCDGEALGQIQFLEGLEPEADIYQIHPAFLDACFQVLVAALPTDAISNTEASPLVPMGVGNMRVYSRPGRRVWSHALVRKRDANAFEGDIRLLDEAGRVMVEALGFRLRHFEPEAQPFVSENLDEWFYELQWEPKGRLEGRAASRLPRPPRLGTWLIFADSTGVGRALAALLTLQGERCILIFHGEMYEQLEGDCFHIRPERPEDLRQLLEVALGSEQPACRGVVHLWSLDTSPPEETTVASLEAAQTLGCGSVLLVVQELARAGRRETPRVWLVTRGAQPVEAEPVPLAVAQAPLWGFGRVIAQEHADLWGGLVDLDPVATIGDASARLWEEIWSPDGEDQLAFRQGQRYVARLVRKRESAGSAFGLRPLFRFKSDGSYLITGGLGDLGLQVARWMVEQGARRLVLLERTQLPPRASWTQVEKGSRLAGKIAAIRELEALGASLHLASVDVADESQLTSFLEAFQREGWPPIRGVVHVAGVLQDGLLLRLDTAALNTVLRPKVVGGWLLHRLLEAASLDFFILFSSAGSLLGQPGQGNYAAANAFLDALAHHRRAQGLQALSINWGAWAGLGFAATSGGGRLARRLALLGIGSIAPKQALEVLERLTTACSAQVMVMPVNWPQYRQSYPPASEARLLSHLMCEETNVPLKADRSRGKESLTRDALMAAEPGGRQRLLESYLCEQVARVMGLSASKLDAELPLNRLGLDSLMAVQLRNRIEFDLGVVVPLVRFLEGLNVAQLVTLLFDQLRVTTPIPSSLHSAVPRGQAMERDRGIKEVSGGTAQEVLAKLDRLSDPEVDSLLSDVLGKEGRGK